MKKILGEFKQFALKGNVLDLAVGVIIGAAFQGIVKSLVDDIISPIIGLFAKKDFSDLVLTVFDVNIRYGAFITAVINFLIMVFLIFLLVKAMNKLSNIGKKQANKTEKEVTTKDCQFCFTKISIKAVRCPNCTSILEKEKIN
ncbi:large conductance mechanosensitive channel protein MscL [Clostridium gasigenes]|uniref:large conductance mechanosensitive channel protein MscL n=1 Tax=Clostridium gasigenes TaxID=94869 RepID=UPI00143863ED|nr:large conductance mechanosensitive channel protein MscL [Clostridium gasigenes]MBU3131397.1 large conductance mechanosensitive channel protein MscL [Clostridium gasigenes]NKF08392.1 large conductance mechanosensitive channel protein MscL [Clostridium gasigenes]QSW18645.1 large conductance mechanosensitive channel protein MscL [Clostridium gasigenes]